MNYSGKLKLMRITIAFAIIITMTATTMLTGQDQAFAASKLKVPKLVSLQYYQSSNGTYNAELKYKAKKKCTYQILRKKSGAKKYKVIGKQKATATTMTYYNKKIGKNKKYTYTVRQIKGKKTSDYDKTGLTLMPRPTVKVDFQNLKSVVTWSKVAKAKYYVIYRKIGESDSWTKIASVSASKTSYTDNFYKKANQNDTKLAKYLTSTVFVDPSNNPIHYTVRPYYSGKYKNKKKTSWGLYLRDGRCHLEAPAIVSLDKDTKTLTWAKVPNADGYTVSCRAEQGDKWTTKVEASTIKATSDDYQSCVVTKGDVEYDYYTVRAYATNNGVKSYSGYDTGFTLRNSEKYTGTKVLFLGDSITYGSPYYKNLCKKFSYPSRIQQLTGIEFFNPSIPGSTYHYDDVYTDGSDRRRIVTSVAGMVRDGNDTDFAFQNIQVGENSYDSIADFDIVVLAAGTNDYNDKNYSNESHPYTNFGSRETDPQNIDDMDKTSDLSFVVNRGVSEHEQWYKGSYDYDVRSFNGAYNQIMKWIEDASVERIKNNKPAIKVVTIGLFYSDRTSKYRVLTNRNVTPNKTIEKTLLEYQAELDYLDAAWAESPVLKIYHYDTQSYNIVNSSSCPYRSSDNLHFTKFVYGLYGNSIADFMIGDDTCSVFNDDTTLDPDSDSNLKDYIDNYVASKTVLEEIDEPSSSDDSSDEDTVEVQGLDNDLTLEQMEDYMMLYE